MAAYMTPLNFAKKFFELDVFLYEQEATASTGSGGYVPPTGWKRLRADNYRLGHSQWRDLFWRDIAPHFNKPVKATVRPISGGDEEIEFRSAHEAFRHYRLPFVGKGSPEHVQLATQLVYRFRKVSTSLEDFMAKDFVGLDCNGFVGGYYQRILQGLDWKAAATQADRDPGPTTLMDDLHALGADVKDTSQLESNGTYIFVWCDDDGKIINPQKGVANSYGHVMITEPRTLKGSPGAQTIQVVEATGSGGRKLRSKDYTIKSVKRATVKQRETAVFFVDRGDPKLMPVRISRLKI